MDLYQELILDHYQHPRNKGDIGRENSMNVVKQTNVGCGDEFTVALQFTKASNVLEKIVWNGQGCAISTASLSVLSEFVIGKTKEEIKQLTKQNVLELLGIDEINPGREKCLTLGLRAIQKATSRKGVVSSQ